MNYESYQMNMLWNILQCVAGEKAKMPKQYHEIVQDMRKPKEIKKVTKQSIKDMFQRSKAENRLSQQ